MSPLDLSSFKRGREREKGVEGGREKGGERGRKEEGEGGKEKERREGGREDSTHNMAFASLTLTT